MHTSHLSIIMGVSKSAEPQTRKRRSIPKMEDIVCIHGASMNRDDLPVKRDEPGLRFGQARFARLAVFVGGWTIESGYSYAARTEPRDPA